MYGPQDAGTRLAGTRAVRGPLLRQDKTQTKAAETDCLKQRPVPTLRVTAWSLETHSPRVGFYATGSQMLRSLPTPGCHERVLWKQTGELGWVRWIVDLIDVTVEN